MLPERGTSTATGCTSSQQEVAAWESQRSQAKSGANWTFTTADAHIKRPQSGDLEPRTDRSANRKRTWLSL
jgi:hypothetical protein